MPSWNQPPTGPPSGPFPGPGPTPFPPPGPPGGAGTSSTTLVLVALAVIALLGGLFLVVNGGDDDDKDSTSAGFTPDDSGSDDEGGSSDELGDLGDLPDETLPDETLPEDTEPPDTEPPAAEPPAEPDAAVNDCIAVDEGGNFLGTGSCSDGGTTYEVIEVVDGYNGSCTNPDQGSTVYGDYRYCVQLHLVETYCYVFPHQPGGPVDGWITVADGCELPGTVHVIDIVPDVDNGDHCTTDYQWNRWYSFSQPTMTVCVMEY